MNTVTSTTVISPNDGIAIGTIASAPHPVYVNTDTREQCAPGLR